MTLSDFAPLANHLWQSTLCVAAVWLLTLALRRNRAAVRYWLWLAASLKFLLPFSLLVSLGSQISLRQAPIAAAAQPQWSYVAENIGRPFAIATVPIQGATAPSSNLVPAILLGAWLCGFLVSLGFWICWSRQIRAARKQATPLMFDFPIPVMSSPTRIEPGVVGIFTPVLLLPEGIAERLTPKQLSAVLAHEMCHVRRRDNLTAAIHMLVEAVFWFYPLVWWIRARLIEERERACDEAVLQMGNDAEAYAEGILSVCKLYVESPLACVSGISGADLRKRIVMIMSGSAGRDLTLRRRLMLGFISIALVAGPVGYGLAINSARSLSWPAQANAAMVQLLHAGGPAVHPFEVVSIRPSKPGDKESAKSSDTIFRSNTIRDVIKFAYDVHFDSQLSGGPNWINTEEYDIRAKPDEATADNMRKLPQCYACPLPKKPYINQIRLMTQQMLADRFKLKVDFAKKELPVYALVIGKSGPKMKVDNTPLPGVENGIRSMGPGQLRGINAHVGLLAIVLQHDPEIDRFVVDETGLKGHYDWTLTWTPVQETSMFKAPDTPDAQSSLTGTTGPSIFTALQEQLGLKLESQKGPVEVLVIDHIERPSPN